MRPSCADSAESDDRQLLVHAESMRRYAILGVGVSLIAALVCILAVPFVFNYVQSVQSLLANEANFCKVRTATVWQQVARTQHLHGVRIVTPRKTRQAGYDSVPLRPAGDSYTPPTEAVDGATAASQESEATYSTPQPAGGSPQTADVQAAPASSSGQCCGCSHGPPGEEGEAGEDGSDGADGGVGADGPPGEDASPDAARNADDQFCFECPPAPAGERGEPGDKGDTGAAGRPGRPASDGVQGQMGAPGEVGPPGAPGRAGNPGKRGRDGIRLQLVGPPGPPGVPGSKGVRGVRGPPGEPGKVGQPGNRGEAGDAGGAGVTGRVGRQGEVGEKGPPGETGPCDCPPPRTSPGY